MLEVLSRPHDAATAYQHAARMAPQNMRALLGLGLMFTAVSRHTEAAVYFERALQQEPENPYALYGLAFATHGQLKFEEAIARYEHALKLMRDSPRLHNNVAFSLTCPSRYDEADDHLRREIELAPNHSNAYKLLGLSELRRGNYRTGWQYYEHRKTTPNGLNDYKMIDIPEWRGEALDGQHCLLAREQEVGDQLQFIRCADVLHGLGAPVDVWTSNELAPPFSRVRSKTTY